MVASGVAVPVYSILSIVSGVLVTGFQNIAGRQIGEGNIEKAKNTWKVTLLHLSKVIDFVDDIPVCRTRGICRVVSNKSISST